MLNRGVTHSQRERARQIVWPWLPTLLRTARILTRHEQDAEDLVQDTAIKAVRAIDTFKEGTDAKAWLLTILRRTHIDSLRAGQRQIHPLSFDAGDGVEPWMTPAGDILYWRDPATDVDRGLIELMTKPEAQRLNHRQREHNA